MSPANDKPLRVIGRYALYAPLASGGMATVHLGRLLGPVGFSRTVAIKRLHERFTGDPEFVSSFLDEARIAARIRHPNVVPTLDVVATDGELFLVMDYVQGESLSRLLRACFGRSETVPVRVATTIVASALHGLHAAHEATNERGEPLHIVHRDVSPQNVIVGVDGVARVLDFGIAKAVGRLQDTREGQLKGKIAYMSPEQIRGHAVDRRTDVYAASVVLWETLTAQRLFSADSDAEVLGRALAGTIEPPSKRVPGISPELDAIVMRGLAREPDARWQTAREMAIALETLVPVETAATIGAWVERVAKDSLASRAASVKEIESGSVPEGRASLILSEIRRGEHAESLGTDRSMSTPVATRAPRRTAPLIVIAVLSIAVGALAMLLFAQTRRAPPPAPSQTLATHTESSASAQAAPPPPVVFPPAPKASAPIVASAPPVVTSAPKPRHAPETHVDCTTPFTFDDMGRKVYKPECVE